MWYKPELMKVKQAAAPKETKYFESRKIIVRMISGGEIIAALDNNNYYLLQDNMILQEDKNYTLEYLICLLNSKLLNFYIKQLATNIAITQNILKYLPIKVASKEIQSPFIDFVDKILAITQDNDYLQNPAKQAKVHEYEKQIDKLVYRLYGLTENEIRVIEGS